MRWHWGSALIVALLTVAVTSGSAAASPRAIMDDYADNGRLDGTYSSRDLQGALQEPIVQGYGAPTAVQGVKGAAVVKRRQEARAAGREAGPLAPQRAGQLPFTGRDIAILVAGAALLLLAGGTLRLLARERSRPGSA